MFSQSARLTVQFQSITEKFSTHETVFSFDTASELSEAALSTACMSHASMGPLTSSSSSLSRRKLGEITEDSEENGAGPKEPATDKSAAESEGAAQHGRSDLAHRALKNAHAESQLAKQGGSAVEPRLPQSPNPTPLITTSLPPPPIPTFDKSLPVTPQDTSPRDKASGKSPPSAQDKTYEDLPRSSEEPFRLSVDQRLSTQSARPALPELSLYSGYSSYKKKKSLGLGRT